MADRTDRRSFLNMSVLGAAGAGAAVGLEESILLAAVKDGKADAPQPKPDLNPKLMPQGKVKTVSISRLLIGGNLIGGYAHSRDLIYVSKLFKAYNTQEKVFQTLELCEQCGINTIQLDPRDWEVVLEYNRQRNRSLQCILCTLPGTTLAGMADHVKQLVDKGAAMVYIHGMVADTHVMSHRIDEVGEIVEIIKRQGVPAGVGSHSLQTPIACEKNKIDPDFYVKTLHLDRYWSATPEGKREEWCWYKPQSSDHDGYHDNIYCLNPQETVAFMEGVEKPWIAFKTMAAGAIHPQVGFQFAFRSGADFVLAGMFDFQVEQDAKLAIDAVRKSATRKRPWRA